MSDQIIGMYGTDVDAIMWLNDPVVTEWLCRPDATYKVYTSEWRKWFDVRRGECAVECFYQYKDDIKHYYVVVKTRGRYLSQMRWECDCGSRSGKDAIPCKHALMAWACRSPRKAKQVVALAKRMLKQKQQAEQK